MSWEVTTSISGGHRIEVADMEVFLTISQQLSDLSEAMLTTKTSWNAMEFALPTVRNRVPMCPTYAAGEMSSTDTHHTSLPFALLEKQYTTHQDSFSQLSSTLLDLADLVIRAHSLYSEAEYATQQFINRITGVLTVLSPLSATLAGAGYSLASAGIASLHEGSFNPVYMLSASTVFQQGFFGGLGAALTGKNLLNANLNNGTSQAADMLAIMGGILNNMSQGNTLTVKQVTLTKASLGATHSVADALSNLNIMAEGNLGSIPMGSTLCDGTDYATIAIQHYVHEDGSNSWLVIIPGTDGQSNSPFGWEQNLELMSNNAEVRKQADSARMVVEAMRRAGIASTDEVALVGHSQGGIVAAEIASDMKDDYHISHIVTAGSPIANHPIPESTWVTSIEMEDELVAALDGNSNPLTDNWLTISGKVRQAESSPNIDKQYGWTEVKGATETKEITHWLKYHQAAYENASGLGSAAVETHEDHFRNILDGNLVETTYWQGRMSK